MKKLTAITLLAAITAGRVVAAPDTVQQSPGPKPRIVCKAPVYDFGKVDNAGTADHTFTIWNEGDAPLTITKVRACCGAKTTLGSKTISPGTNTTVAVKLSLRRRRGALRKSIYVVSNDPVRPRLQLRIQGQVVAQLDVRPGHVNFGAVSTNSVMRKEVLVTSQLAGNLRVTNVTSSVACFSADFEMTATNSYRIAISTVPPFPEGTTRGQIEAFTDSEKYPSIRIPVTASVVNDVLVVPRAVVLRASDQPVAVTRYVVLRSRSKRSFSVLDVESPSSGTETTISKYPGGGYRCELKNLTVDMNLNGKKIVIHTDHPDSPAVSVPIHVTKARR